MVFEEKCNINLCKFIDMIEKQGIAKTLMYSMTLTMFGMVIGSLLGFKFEPHADVPLISTTLSEILNAVALVNTT